MPFLPLPTRATTLYCECMAMFFILRKWKVFIFLLLVVCMLTMLLYVVLEHYNPDVRRTPVSGSKASHGKLAGSLYIEIC